MPDVFPREAPEPRALLGWDGTAFYVLACDGEGNLRLAPGGVNLRQYDSTYRAAASAVGDSGTISAGLAAVAAGRLLMVQRSKGWLTAGSAGRLDFVLVSGGVDYVLDRKPAPAVMGLFMIPGDLVLAAGDFLRLDAFNVGPGTTLLFRVAGYYVQ